jgi:hypothetical protein
MSSSPKSHAEYVSILKNTAKDLALTILKRELVKQLPFLAFPVINPIFNFFVQRAVTILIDYSEFAAFFAYVDLRVDAQARTFQRAILQNHKAQQTGTEEEKALAEKELIDRFRQLAILGS